MLPGDAQLKETVKATGHASRQRPEGGQALAWEFDDGSRFVVLFSQWRQAFEAIFGPWAATRQRAWEFLRLIVDYFWDSRTQPTRQGDEVEWAMDYSTKAELAHQVMLAVLGPVVNHFLFGPDKDGTPESQRGGMARKKRGQEALKAARESALALFGSLVQRGLLHRARKLMEVGMDLQAAGDLEVAVSLDERNAQAWLCLSIIYRRLAEEFPARAAAYRAAELLHSPYLGRAQCPRCGWVPLGLPLWECSGCGARLDAFEAEGRCAACGRTDQQAQCPVCGVTSGLGRWWKAAQGQAALEAEERILAIYPFAVGVHRDFLRNTAWNLKYVLSHPSLAMLERRMYGHLVLTTARLALVRAFKGNRVREKVQGRPFNTRMCTEGWEDYSMADLLEDLSDGANLDMPLPSILSIQTSGRNGMYMDIALATPQGERRLRFFAIRALADSVPVPSMQSMSAIADAVLQAKHAACGMPHAQHGAAASDTSPA